MAKYEHIVLKGVPFLIDESRTVYTYDMLSAGGTSPIAIGTMGTDRSSLTLSSQTGNLVLRNELVHGAQASSQPNEVKSAHSSSLQSRVAPERLLESLQLQPARKVLRISREDIQSIASVLEHYSLQIEKMI